MSTRGERMELPKPLRSAKEADLVGEPCPPNLLRWLATLPARVIEILDRLAEQGHGAWLVGGCVRDAWFGDEVGDIDICSTCPPEEMLNLFGNDAIPTGVEFGTVTIKGDGEHFEVTTLRTESQYRDGRHPEQVEWGTSLQEDLSRRDFTINSMAVDVARGLLYDPFEGKADMEANIIRAVGNAQLRCEEDSLRILRAYRFLERGTGQLWRMDPGLKEAIQLHSKRLDMVAVERRWNEVKKILMKSGAGKILHTMMEDGVLKYIFPHCQFISPKIFDAMDQDAVKELTVPQRLSLLLVEYKPKVVFEAMKFLKTSKTTMKDTCRFHEQLRHLPQPMAGELRVFRHCLGQDAAPHLMLRKVLSTIGVTIHGMPQMNVEDIDKITAMWDTLQPSRAPSQCLVDGHWMMSRSGVGQGIRLGRLKEWLHRIQIEKDIDDRLMLERELSLLPFNHGDHEHWPKLQFP